MHSSHSSLVWRPINNLDGISVYWKQISVHGISTVPSKCIYFMLDHQLKWPGIYECDDEHSNGISDHHDCDVGNEADEELFNDAEEMQITECWLIPEDQNSVNTMYQAMTECQALHPDSDDSISEDSEYMDDDEEDCNDVAVGNPSIDDGNEGVDEAGESLNNMSIYSNRFADADE